MFRAQAREGIWKPAPSLRVFRFASVSAALPPFGPEFYQPSFVAGGVRRFVASPRMQIDEASAIGFPFRTGGGVKRQVFFPIGAGSRRQRLSFLIGKADPQKTTRGEKERDRALTWLIQLVAN